MPLPTSNEKMSFASLMQRGIQLHADGQPELALVAFETARAWQPNDTDAACASATLLSALSRPMAAYQVLLAAKESLWTQSDGAANLAIAAENCGHMTEAKCAYQRALTLDPNHLRSLNNMGLLAASQSDWATAIDLARQCVALEPDDASYRQNLSDHLAGARRYPEALQVLADAAKRFSDYLDITVRRIIVLAFKGEFEKSQQLEATLDAESQNHLLAFVKRSLALPGNTSAVYQPEATKRDAFDLYTWQAFHALTVCDWRGHDKLTANLRAVAAGTLKTGKSIDWLGLQFYAQLVDLRDDELATLNDLQTQAPALSDAPAIPVFTATRKAVVRQQDPRIHVGLAVHSLHDAQHLRTLKRQLALHDKARFAIHVYSSTQQPGLAQEQALRPHAASVVQIAHMSDLELASRIRLDQLDVFVDMASEPGTPRPNIAHMRVAPVQVCNTTWQRHRPPGPFEYCMSDPFMHAHADSSTGAVARLPVTCWLALHDAEQPDNPPSRHAIGLPPGAFVLCAMFEPAKLDPATFAVWMRILKSLPDAVLWLPACNVVVRGNLLAEALAADVPAGQIVFSDPLHRAHMMVSMRHADLFLDTLRFSSAPGMEDALRTGVPAISCSGNHSASRLGSSLLRAAGLPECVFDTPQAYAAEAIRLGQNRVALTTLRRRLEATHPSTPLFDVAARIKEWEAAWTVMVERSRAGLPPTSFDIPLAQNVS